MYVLVKCFLYHKKNIKLCFIFCLKIRLWDLSTKKCISNVQAHDGLVHGLCSHRTGEFFLSVSIDLLWSKYCSWCYSNRFWIIWIWKELIYLNVVIYIITFLFLSSVLLCLSFTRTCSLSLSTSLSLSLLSIPHSLFLNECLLPGCSELIAFIAKWASTTVIY